jgi:Cys-tRNA synthase (O-phospho-L-seryl-tRNA:Cys-tRNA synthase)
MLEERLTTICKKIEAMPQFNQIEILKIISKHKEIILNENKNGIHINLTEISSLVIDELCDYIDYINAQEMNLNIVEAQKEEFKNTYFTKDIKKDNKDNGKYFKYAST